MSDVPAFGVCRHCRSMAVRDRDQERGEVLRCYNDACVLNRDAVAARERAQPLIDVVRLVFALANLALTLGLLAGAGYGLWMLVTQ